MENKAYAFAAGLFTLLLGIGVVAAALWFSGDTVETREYLLVSRYPVSGLNSQAPVRYRGVTVGKVVSIRFDLHEPRTILVEVQIQTGTPLTKGTYAQLGSQGITGLSYVILDDDGSKPEQLAGDGDSLARIEVRPSFMDVVTGSGQDLITNVDQVAKRMNVLLSDDNQKQLFSTLRHLDQVTGSVTSLARTAESNLKALPALLSDTGVVLKRADALLTNLNQRVESFESAATGVARSAELLGKSGTELSDTIVTESLPRLNLLLEDVQRSSRSLERLVSDISEQPHSLVFGRNPLPPGPGEPGFGAQRGAR